MRKLLLSISTLFIVSIASAQIIPSFQFGAKAGLNLSHFTTSGTFNSNNQAGYLGGFYARFGALGFNFQPELYATSKNVSFTSPDGSENKAKFTSIDMPLLFGGKIGAFGLGARFYTGPLVSFVINKDQSFGGALGNAVSLDYKNQNFAWQVGTGLDIRNLGIDFRYEAGISKQTFPNGSNSRVNLFNLSLAYKLF